MRPVLDALARHASEIPDRVAFRQDDRAITWAQLHGRVHALAAALNDAPPVIAVRLSGIDYVIADLGVTLAGKRLVPVPHFFSAAQVAHIVTDAGAGLVLDDSSPLLRPATGARAAADAGAYAGAYAGGGERVIYTSGTSGQPKGVVLGDRQLEAAISGLAGAVAPEREDRYLSVLPAAQLLEQVCAFFLPIVAGAEVRFSAPAMAVLFGGAPGEVASAMAAARPTATVVAPKQLAAWVASLRQSGTRAPDSLRFVAVGGAPSDRALLGEAEALGIPVHEGYGLSEACSVVALNRARDNRPGTVGRPLAGVSVEIIGGEIVVSGPTVMSGYLHGDAPRGGWHTGDLGRIEDGRLIVEGRRDAVIVTPAGRNISPEWVEAAALADPAIIAAALVQQGGDLVLVVAPGAAPDIAALIARIATLPGYAQPGFLLITDPRAPGLIRASGAPDRAVARALAEANRAAWRALTANQQKEAASQ